MRKFFLVSLVILITLMFTTLAPQVLAQENSDPWVRTEDLDDDTEDYFEYIGETVRIIAHSSLTPYDIEVYDPNGALVKTIEDINTVDYEGDHDDISSSEGWWALKLFHATAQYALGTYFVITEVPLGAATVLIACFAGLGYKQLRFRQRKS